MIEFIVVAFMVVVACGFWIIWKWMVIQSEINNYQIACHMEHHNQIVALKDILKKQNVAEKKREATFAEMRGDYGV